MIQDYWLVFSVIQVHARETLEKKRKIIKQITYSDNEVYFDQFSLPLVLFTPQISSQRSPCPNA